MAVIYFKEIQYLRKTNAMVFVLIICLIVILLYVMTFLQQQGLINEILSSKANFIVFHVSQILSIPVIYFLIPSFLLKLEVKLSSESITYRMPPFINKIKEIPIESIKHIQIIKNKSLRNYAGWRIRRVFGRRRKILVIIGSKGVRIDLNNGKRIILGSQKPEMFVAAFEKLKKKNR